MLGTPNDPEVLNVLQLLHYLVGKLTTQRIEDNLLTNCSTLLRSFVGFRARIILINVLFRV